MILADVALVTDQLAIYEFYKRFVFQRLTIIKISWCYHKVEKISFFIANQMQLEAKEPTHRAFSSLIYAFENLMNMYSLVFADTQWCAVNEAVCRRLGISKRTLQSYRDTGKIPFSMIGHKCYYKQTDISEMLNEVKK